MNPFAFLFRDRRPNRRRTRRTRLSLEYLENRTLLAAGALDPSFSGNGTNTVNFNLGGTNDDRAMDLAIDALGRIVMVGFANDSGTDYDFAVTRLTATGALDTTFGTGGRATFGFGLGGGFDDRANSVAIDALGRIVVAGFAQVNSSGDYNFAVLRLLDNGTLDDSFNGNGKNNITFSTGSNSDDRATDVAIDSQGRIILAGYSQVSGNDYDFGVVRLTSTGDLDNSFDGDGKRRVAFDLGGGLNDRANGVAIDTQDRIVVAGFAQVSSTNHDFAVARLNALDGSLDGAFGVSGTTTVAINLGGGNDDGAEDVLIDGSGRIVLGGYAQFNPGPDVGYQYAVARLLSTGAPDTAFSNDGQVVISTFNNGNQEDRAFALALAPQNRIIVVGQADLGGSLTLIDFGVVRINNDGTTSGTFGEFGTGKVAVDFPNVTGVGAEDVATGVAIDANGKIVIGGYTYISGTNYNFAAARLEADTVQWAPNTATVAENGGSVTLTVTRASGTTAPVTVEFATSDGTAVAGQDYTPTSGTLTFATSGVGITQRTIVIPILNDSLFENGNETFSVVLSGSTRALIAGGATATVTITDNDPPPVVALSAAAYSINETFGLRTVTVTRTGSEGAFTVNYATSDATALDGLDYTAVSGSLSFTATQTTRTFTIPITNDGLVEGNETFNVALSNPVGATLGTPSTAVITIVDDEADAISGFVFDDLNGSGSFNTGEAGLAGWQVYLDRNNNYVLDAGDTSTLTDSAGNYVFSALGAGTYVVREVVPSNWVQSFPASRSYTVVLSGTDVTGRDFGNWQRGSISGRVVNDLNGNGVVDAGEPGVPNAIVYFDDDINTATGLEEFTGRRNQITTGFQASTNVPLAIPDQGVAISDRLIRDQHGIVADVNVRLTITHTRNADLRAFLISPSGTRIELFNPAVVGGSNFTNTTFDDQAATAIDAGTAPYNATFRPTGSLAAFNGQDMTGNWRLEINDTAAGNVGTLTAWSLNFVYDERVVVTDAAGNYLFTGLAADTHQVRVEIPGGWVQSFPRDRGNRAPIVQSGSSEIGRDFGLFQRGSLSGALFNDTNADGDRDVGEAGVAAQTVFLDQNGNGLPDTNTVTINPPRGFQPRNIGDTSTIRLRLPVAGIAGILTDVNVNLNITHTFDSDLRVSLVSPLGTSVVLLEGVGGNGMNFTGTTLDDQAATSITSGTAPFTGSFKPLNPLSAFNGEDPTGAWFLKIEDTASEDSGTLNTFTLTLTYTEATTTTDASGNYTFTGVTPGLHTVRTVPPSGFVVTAPMSGFQNVPFLSGQVATGVDLGIAAGSAGQLQFSASSYSVNENAGPATITVTRTGGTLGAATVQFTTTPGTAIHGSDFTPQIGVLTFASGQSSAIFTVPIINDPIAEGSETLSVSLFTPTGNAAIGSPSFAVLTILDDDVPQVGTISGNVFNDANGNRLRDGEPGLAGWTVFLGQSGNGAIRDSLTRTFNSTNVPVAIPDLGVSYSTLAVTNLGTATAVAGPITDLNVSLGLAHTYDQDLQVYLISPTGTRVLLVDRAGADGDNFTGTTLDDEAATPVASGLAPFSGSFRPAQALSAFDGQDLAGIWRLEINDVAAEDVGSLTSWSLQITWRERAVLTDANGNYSFANLTPGPYTIQVIRQDGWLLTTPIAGANSVTLAAGQNATGFDFGLRQQGAISGTKFNDLNGDGAQQSNENGLGNWTIYLDQNGSGTRDTVTTTFSATGLPQPIPDLGTLDSYLAIAGVAGPITDVNISLNIDHALDSDTQVLLHSPRGSQITLFSGVGGTRQGFTTTFDDLAGSSITGVSGTGTTRITGTFSPQELLSTFNGEELSGTWRLEVKDNFAGNAGTLNSWSLQITYEEASTTTNSLGNYTLGSLTPGTYTVREVPQSGWTQTAPAGGAYTVALLDNENAAGRDFGNQQAINTLQVTRLQRLGNGFNLYFNQAIDPTVLNLYDTQAGSLGAADLTIVGATTGPVRGSATLNAANTLLFFTRTDGLLLPDTYTITLRSAANGLRTPAGGLLDGNRDGTTGDDYVATSTVPVTTTPVLSLPEIARGPGQALNVSAASLGLPLRLSDGAGIDSLSVTLLYNAALLTLTGATVGAGVPAGAAVSLVPVSPGNARLTFLSPSALPAGPIDFVILTASVPDTAAYGAKHKLNVLNSEVNEGARTVQEDDGLHVVAYPGDTSGGARYSSLDATQALRVAVGFDAGFQAYPLADPRVIADLNGNGRVDSTDATTILKEAVGIDQAAIPALPANAPVLTVLGPDPLLQFPRNLKGQPGDTFTVPLKLSPSDGLEAADLAISYDTTRLEVVAVERGELTADFDLFWSNLDATAGTLRVGLGRTAGPIAERGDGSVLQITFRVRHDAPAGRAIINLRANVGSTRTSLNEGGLDLIPDPSNTAGDVLDGVITVRSAPRPAVQRVVKTDGSDERSWAAAVTAVFRAAVRLQDTHAADLVPDLVSAVLALDARTLQRKFGQQS